MKIEMMEHKLRTREFCRCRSILVIELNLVKMKGITLFINDRTNLLYHFIQFSVPLGNLKREESAEEVTKIFDLILASHFCVLVKKNRKLFIS